MDVAHELGHLVMHNKGIPRSRQAEFEANRFAGAILMPARDILAHVPRATSLGTIHKMKARWKVAAIALVYRLWTLNLLSEWQYRMFCKDLSAAGYRRGEKDGIVRESSQILVKVFDALRQDGVSRASIARDLSITFDELNALISGLVLSAVTNNPTQQSTSEVEAPKEKPILRIV